jgi:hypothetical protein
VKNLSVNFKHFDYTWTISPCTLVQSWSSSPYLVLRQHHDHQSSNALLAVARPRLYFVSIPWCYWCSNSSNSWGYTSRFEILTSRCLFAIWISFYIDRASILYRIRQIGRKVEEYGKMTTWRTWPATSQTSKKNTSTLHWVQKIGKWGERMGWTKGGVVTLIHFSSTYNNRSPSKMSFFLHFTVETRNCSVFSLHHDHESDDSYNNNKRKHEVSKFERWLLSSHRF